MDRFPTADLNVHMIFTWNTKLLDDCLATLTHKEKAALDLEQILPSSRTFPGEERLEKYGFISLTEYIDTLYSAKMHARMYFASMGIRHVDDVPFEEPGSSTEGRLRVKMRLKERKQAKSAGA